MAREPRALRALRVAAIPRLQYADAQRSTAIMAAQKKKDPEGVQNICRNKRAFHDYEVLDTLECGLVLTGTEVKSLREGTSSLEQSYAKIEGNEVWLLGSDIP